MSRYFTHVFFPLIKAQLQNHPEFKSSDKNKSPKRQQSKSKQKQIKKEQSQNSEVLRRENLNIFRSTQISQTKSPFKQSKRPKNIQLTSNTQYDIYHDNSNNNYSHDYSFEKLKIQEESYQDDCEEQKFDKKREKTSKYENISQENSTQMQNYHHKLQQTLIENASTQKQTQRLSTIFESARKNKVTRAVNMNHSQKKDKNTQLFKQIPMDEASRRHLRKTFCLKIVEDDDQWEAVCSKSKSMKKKQRNNFENS